MSTTYGKLTEYGSLQILTRIPCVSNATPEMIAAYALANDYHEVVYTPAPGRYYVSSFELIDDKIVESWKADDIDKIKEQSMEEVQSSLNNQLTVRATVPCTLGFNVIYDIDAQINLLGLLATGMGAEAFIDADNNIHSLSAQELLLVAAAVMGHKQNLYTKATEIRAQIAAAKTVEELELISPWVFYSYETPVEEIVLEAAPEAEVTPEVIASEEINEAAPEAPEAPEIEESVEAVEE